MRKVGWLFLMLAGCGSGKAVLEVEGEASGASVVCEGTQCWIQVGLTLTDLEGSPVEETLWPSDFAFDGVQLAQEGGTAPSVTNAAVDTLTQEILGEHLCLTLLLDQSGSITDTDPDDARIAGAQQIISAVLTSADDVDRVGLMAFPRVYASLGDLDKTDIWQPHTNDTTLLDEALVRMADSEGNETPLFESILETAEYIGASPECEGAQRVMVVVTDGEDTDSAVDPDEALGALEAAGVRMYAVGLGEEIDRIALRKLTRETGGTYQDTDVGGLDTVIADLSAAFFGTVNLYGELTLSEALTPERWYTVSGDVWYAEELRIPFMQSFYVSP